MSLLNELIRSEPEPPTLPPTPSLSGYLIELALVIAVEKTVERCIDRVLSLVEDCMWPPKEPDVIIEYMETGEGGEGGAEGDGGDGREGRGSRTLRTLLPRRLRRGKK